MKTEMICDFFSSVLDFFCPVYSVFEDTLNKRRVTKQLIRLLIKLNLKVPGLIVICILLNEHVLGTVYAKLGLVNATLLCSRCPQPPDSERRPHLHLRHDELHLRQL